MVNRLLCQQLDLRVRQREGLRRIRRPRQLWLRRTDGGASKLHFGRTAELCLVYPIIIEIPMIL